MNTCMKNDVSRPTEEDDTVAKRAGVAVHDAPSHALGRSRHRRPFQLV